MKQMTISSNDADQRLDKFILKSFPSLSKGVLYKAIRTKNIKLNGKRCEISTRLSIGDEVRIFISDELLGEEKKEISHNFMKAGNILMQDIVYEDENILLINKKAGIIVHSDNKITDDTLADRVKKYLYQKNEYMPDCENSFAPALCNRLDRNTAGIVIAAKNAGVLREINRKIKENEITKKYLCLLSDAPSENAATLTAYHKKDSRTNTVAISGKPHDGYKQIITKYKVLGKRNDAYLAEIELVTGRTHQIRAHMAYIGCPLVGDSKYGKPSVKYSYQALCAYKLRFERSSGSILSYLDGREFKLNDIWFLK